MVTIDVSFDGKRWSQDYDLGFTNPPEIAKALQNLLYNIEGNNFEAKAFVLDEVNNG